MNPDTLRQIAAEMRLKAHASRYWCAWERVTEWADRIEAEIAKVVADATTPDGWREPGPVTLYHPFECLIVLPALRQTDGEWWLRGDHFIGEHVPIAWIPDTTATRAMLSAAIGDKA